VEKFIRARADTDLTESVGAPTVAWLGRADQCFSGVATGFCLTMCSACRLRFGLFPSHGQHFGVSQYDLKASQTNRGSLPTPGQAARLDRVAAGDVHVSRMGWAPGEESKPKVTLLEIIFVDEQTHVIWRRPP